MRLLLIFSALTFASFANGQTKNIAQIRYNGFYRNVSDIYIERHGTICNYLRFYPDGKVISVASDEATAYDLKKWFNLTMDNSSIGKYEVRGKRLYFSTISREGTVIYKGKINDQYYLFLRSKSLINGYKKWKKYYFIEISDLK